MYASLPLDAADKKVYQKDELLQMEIRKKPANRVSKEAGNARI